MNRNSHAGVLSKDNYFEPNKSTKAIRRLFGRSRHSPKSTDQRDLTDYLKNYESLENRTQEHENVTPLFCLNKLINV